MALLPDSDASEKRYYSISEVAERLGVAPSLIRFWESEFEQLKPHKNSKGERRFTPENLEILEIIYQLVKVRGFTLQGAQLELKRERGYLQGKMRILEKLREIRRGLEGLKNDLEQAAAAKPPSG